MKNLNLTIEADVVEHMKGATSSANWDARCDEVKHANGGYPAFWFKAINMSGLMSEVLDRFKK